MALPIAVGERLILCKPGTPCIRGIIHSIRALAPVAIDMAGTMSSPLLVVLTLDDGSTLSRRLLL
jgi:hypothetical protein